MKSALLASVAGALLLSGCATQEYASGQCPNTLAGWRKPGVIGHQVPAYFVTLEANGELTTSLWMGYGMEPVEKTDRRGLRQLMSHVPEMNPLPMVILKPAAEAACSDVKAIRAEMDATLDCKAGKCGEGAGWSELPGMPVVG